MRLIIKEYVAQLKEKDELDFLLCDLYAQKGYIVDNRPKTGNRQYGVDIQMHNATNLLLLVVKQGNIDRNVWTGNQNAVRESLDEIRDAYLNRLTEEEKNKKIKIIVATNGDKEEAILANWNGYVKNNSIWNGKKIEISFCGIDEIVSMIHTTLFNEHIFKKDIQSAIRKALYFVGESDYKKQYYEKIVDELLEQVESTNKLKEQNKLLVSLYMACEMMCQYASDNGVNKISIMISEYLLIKYWKYLYCNNKLGKNKYVEWLIKFCRCYEKWNDLYYEKIEGICKEHTNFPNYNVVENRVILYEVLGYLISYATYLTDIKPDKAKKVLNSIINLLNNYPEFVYAPYDSDIGIIISLYRLLAKYGRQKEIKAIMRYQGETLKLYYQKNGKYPAPSDSFEEAVKIEFQVNEEQYEVSGFWGYFMLCMICLDCEEIYDEMKIFLDDELKSVTKCVWFFRENEEDEFYNYYAMNLSGEGVSLELEKNYTTLQNKIKFILGQYENEKMSFDEYSFGALEIIICRYYGYIPRVNYSLLGVDARNNEC